MSEFMDGDRYPYETHKYLINGEDVRPCPFCGEMPILYSCARLIVFSCEKCDYSRHFHGLVQSNHETSVVVSRYSNNDEAYEWYDTDAFDKALKAWNTRADGEEQNDEAW